MCVQPTEELSELPQRVAELNRDQRHRREDGRGGAPSLANGTCETVVLTSDQFYQAEMLSADQTEVESVEHKNVCHTRQYNSLILVSCLKHIKF